MKCINMKIAEILFFIANFIAINTSVVRKDKMNQTTTVISKEVTKSKFDQNCLHVLKIIRENDLKNYVLDCKATGAQDVLGHACFVVKNMLTVACEKQPNETKLDLLGRNNTNKICPFDFSHLGKFRSMFESHEIVKRLAEGKFCQKACERLYTTENQCIVLAKFNSYLKATVPNPKVDLSPASPHVTNSTIQRTEKSYAVKPRPKQPPLNTTKPHEVITKSKPETPVSQSVSQLTETSRTSTKALKENKTEIPIQSELPIEEPREKAEPPRTEMKLPETENEDALLGNEDTLMEEGLSNEDNLPENDLGLSKVDLSREPDLEEKANPKEKEASLREKNSYIGEGFSQAEDSHFFFYFIMVSSVVVVGYLAFHNKNKILAYALEGSSSRRSRRRPNPARYRKLETNLEEAISSGATNAASSSVVY